MSKVWLVTGSASGLGRNIAEAVLASGDRLVATARDPGRLEDLVEKYDDQVRTAPLDVADEAAAYAAVQVAIDAFGRLDVVVNNAGYGDFAPSPYHAVKWAVGGFTESLAKEVAPFGVKVCALEPAGMRTNWGARVNRDRPDLLPDYEPSVGGVMKALESRWGHENSDPAKVAQVVLRLAASDCLPAHLLIGSDAVQHADQAEATRAADAERWREVSVSTETRMLPGPCLHCNSDRSACSTRYSKARMGIKSTIRTGVTAKFDLARVPPWPAFCHARNKTRPRVFFIAGHSGVTVPQAEHCSLLREQDVARAKVRQC